MKYSLGISNFLEEISSLSHSVVFLYFLHWSLWKAFLSLLAILWNSAFKCLYLSFSPLLFASLLYTAICKASSDSHFAFLHFFSMGMVLIPVSCTMSRTSVHSCDGAQSVAERNYPTSKVRGRSQEDPMPEGQRPRGVTPRQRSGAAPRVPGCDRAGMAKRSYPTSEVRGNSRGELPRVRGQGRWPRVPGCDSAGAAERSYPTSEVRGGGQEELSPI